MPADGTQTSFGPSCLGTAARLPIDEAALEPRWLSPNLLPWGGESTKAQQAARGGVTRLKGPAAASAIIAGRPESSVPLMDPKLDPCVSNPDAYQVLFENDRVRVLRYHDHPATEPCARPPRQRHRDTVIVPAPLGVESKSSKWS